MICGGGQERLDDSRTPQRKDETRSIGEEEIDKEGKTSKVGGRLTGENDIFRF